MSYHQDWLMRQIEVICATLGYLLTGKKEHAAEVRGFDLTFSDTNPLYVRLRLLLRDGDVCGAEDLLYEAMEEDDPNVPEAAVRFYEELNALSDRELAEANFSRQEILEGLRQIGERYGAPVL